MRSVRCSGVASYAVNRGSSSASWGTARFAFCNGIYSARADFS